jgi:hypothetical protein
MGPGLGDHGAIFGTSWGQDWGIMELGLGIMGTGLGDNGDRVGDHGDSMGEYGNRVDVSW